MDIPNNTPFEIFGWGSTDGYRDNIEGYCISARSAQLKANEVHASYQVSGRSHWAIRVDGRTYLLATKTPIYLEDDLQIREAIKTKALAKLNSVEREILGLK